MSTARSPWRVPEERAGTRLDRALAEATGVPRNQVHGWIEGGRVRIDGAVEARSSRTLRTGELLAWEAPAPVESRIEGEAGELALLHLDEDLIVLDKPPRIAMHPGAGRPTSTLAHRLLGRFPELAGIGGPGRPGIVHRLDRDTSGVLVVARNASSYERLARAFAGREVEKRYLAIVHGAPQPRAGEIDQPIGRHATRRTEMAVRAGGRRALTVYRTLAESASPDRRRPAWALLELDLRTGRTHQIRVHLKHLKHPVAGDETYGRPDSAPRLALHAWRLDFAHPRSGERVHYRAPFPADLAGYWRSLAGTAPPVE